MGMYLQLSFAPNREVRSAKRHSAHSRLFCARRWRASTHQASLQPTCMNGADRLGKRYRSYGRLHLAPQLVTRFLRGRPSPPLLRQVYGALTELSDRELANLLWGFAVLGQHSSWVLDSLLAHSCCHGFAGYSAGSLHLMVWSLGKLHHAPSEQWLAGFLAAAQAAFFRFAPTELANVVWALAKLGVAVPAAWLDAFLLVAQWRFPSFSPRLLSIVAWSTATLNHRPQQEWLVCFEEQVGKGRGAGARWERHWGGEEGTQWSDLRGEQGPDKLPWHAVGHTRQPSAQTLPHVHPWDQIGQHCLALELGVLDAVGYDVSSS